MRVNVTSKSYCFRHPFFVSYLGEALPAGNYRVEAYDRVVMGVKVITYEPVLVLLHINAPENAFNSSGVIPIDPDELDLIFMNDQQCDVCCNFLDGELSEQEEDLIAFLNHVKRDVRAPLVVPELV